MATYTGTQKGTVQHNTSVGGNGWRDQNATVVTAAPTTADAIVVLDVPAGVRLDTLRFRSGDMDTGTGTLTMNIGYRSKMAGGSLAASATYFASASAAFAAATTTWQELVFNAIKFDEPVEIVMVPAVAANALGASATCVFQGEGVVYGIT